MRFLALLPIASLAAGYVVPDEHVLQELGETIVEKSQNALDFALGKVAATTEQINKKILKTGYDVEAWLSGSPFDEPIDVFDDDHHLPHHGPPHDGPPHDKPPHHKPPHHKKPHHPPHHHKSNLTVYQLISKSKYTTKLAKTIDEYPDLVDLLNSTKTNYTIFAPTDEAFDKMPKHGEKPSKEFIKDALLHHISDDFYPAGRVLHSYTIPTLYQPKNLGNKQRLTVRVTLHGPAINFYSRLVAVNIFGSNGVIHGVDHIIVPPPQVLDIISLLPGEFSTFDLALRKTELWDKANSTLHPRTGGTLFTPSNFAFQKLGPKINAFLFSKYGRPYLKALLEYHMVQDQTFYTDAFFGSGSDDGNQLNGSPYLHYDLPTVLGKPLAVDVIRRGPFVFVRINGFSRVTIHDGVASDGVIQVVSDVLIPPKRSGSELVQWEGEELSVEELKERLDPLLAGGVNLEL